MEQESLKVYEVIEQSLTDSKLVEFVVDMYHSQVMALHVACEYNRKGNLGVTHFVRIRKG